MVKKDEVKTDDGRAITVKRYSTKKALVMDIEGPWIYRRCACKCRYKRGIYLGKSIRDGSIIEIIDEEMDKKDDESFPGHLFAVALCVFTWWMWMFGG